MFDVIAKVADDLKAHASANKARYLAEVKSLLHDLLKTLETEAEKVVVATAAGADETGPGADVLNGQEANGTLPSVPPAPAA